MVSAAAEHLAAVGGLHAGAEALLSLFLPVTVSDVQFHSVSSKSGRYSTRAEADCQCRGTGNGGLQA